MGPWNIFLLFNPMNHGLPLALTFLDLKNAFGSVSHKLINDMLSHIRLPTQVRAYISSTYSKISAYVSTKHWSTAHFQINKEVFQGDTLSPLIFLIAFNSIVEAVNQLPTLAYHLRLPKKQAPDLPPSNSHIYAYWDESTSTEPKGWYLVKVTSIDPEGSALLLYRKGKMEETVNLNKIRWIAGRGNGKCSPPLPK